MHKMLLLYISKSPLKRKQGDKEGVSGNQAQVTLLAKLAKLENLAASFTQQIYDVDNNLLQSGEGQFTLAAPNYLELADDITRRVDHGF